MVADIHNCEDITIHVDISDIRHRVYSIHITSGLWTKEEIESSIGVKESKMVYFIYLFHIQE